jgi:TonB family protein
MQRVIYQGVLRMVRARQSRVGMGGALCAVACAWASLARGAPAAPPTPSSTPSAPASAPAPAPVLTAPKLASDPSVPYPEGASGDAEVVLRLIIARDGAVSDVTAPEAREPDAVFANAAMKAARGWRFAPATRDGAPIPAVIKYAVRFIDDGERVAASAPSGPDAVTVPTRASPAGAVAGAEDITIRGEHGEPGRTASLTRAEVREIPGTFGDPFRAIEIMPGVTPIVSGLPFFFVRGAPPGDVGYYLDGIKVPYLFHVGAGPSVIQPGLVDRVDLYPGGYPARFGRFSGGIVDGEATAPSKELHGEYNVRLFDAGGMVETPFDNGKGTLLVGGRYSYTGEILSLLSNGVTLDYWDYQGRVSYALTPRDTVSAFAFGAYDYLGQKTPTGVDTLFGTEFHRLDVRHDHKLDAGNIRTAITGGIDTTQLGDGRSVRDRMLAMRTELTYKLTKGLLLRAGSDVQVDAYDVILDTGGDLSAAERSVIANFPSRTDLETGIRGDVVWTVTPRLEVTPGMRLDFYGSQGVTAIGVDPRLSTRLALTKDARVLTALGIAHQTPSFILPVPGFQPGGLPGGLQTAVQESMGMEFDLGSATTATATVFHNGFFNLSDALSVLQPTASGCAPGTFPTDSLAGDRGTQPTGTGGGCGVNRFPPGTLGPDRSGGGGQAASSTTQTNEANAYNVRANGQAYGLELFLKRKLTSHVGGFLSYTLSRSTRVANGQEYIASFDRTHVLNAALAFDLGHNWRAGTRFTFYTGLPKAPDPSDPGSTRLDPFYRVDLRLEKRWQIPNTFLGKKAWVSFVAEWLNATLTKEAIGTSCTLSGCTETLIGPVTIPSLGMEGGF